MNPKRLMRNYKESDARFLSNARFLVDLLDKNFEEFNRFDPDCYSSCFPQRLKDKIVKIEKSPSDIVIRNMLAAKTEKMQQCLASCLDEMHMARYFVKKICNNESAEIEQFCYREMQDNYSKPDKALRIFEDFVKQVEKRWDALTAAHYPTVNLVKLQELLKAFQTARQDQCRFKKERGSATFERVEQLNDLWKEVKSVQQVAVNYIYKKRPEMQALFTI